MIKIHNLRDKLLTKTIALLIAILSLSITNGFTTEYESSNDKNADKDSIEITKVLTQEDAPNGVVFELIGNQNTNYLPNALTKIETYNKQLRAKYPKIKIAVVAHGAEQFELTKQQAQESQQSHQGVQRLVAADIPVHICESHASWRGVTTEDFPDYITPSPQGPYQIKQYQALGYILVVVE